MAHATSHLCDTFQGCYHTFWAIYKDCQSLIFKMISSIIAISLAVISVFGQTCSPSVALDQITTGAYTFSLLPLSSRVQCFNTSLDTYFASTKPQVAVGVSGVGNFQSDSAGLDFSLRCLLYPSNTQLSLVLIVNNGSWGSLTASYLVTSRPEFLLGNALSNGNLLATCNKQQSYPLSFSVASTPNIANAQSLGILIFLSGIRTPSSLFSLQFTQPTFDPSSNQLNTSVITNATKEIQLLQIYYLLVDLSKFAANGYNYTFSLTSAFSDYSLSGVISVNSQSLQFAFFAINRTARLSCAGFSCSNCQTADSCAALGGQVVLSQCVKCSGNQVLVNGVCACSSGQVVINGTCQVCPQGTVFNALFNSCTTICSSNQIWSNGSCLCVQGYSLVNGKCQLLKCGTNEYYYQGACSPCPINSVSYADQSGCACVTGYTYVAATASCSLSSPTPTLTNNFQTFSSSAGGSSGTSGTSSTSGSSSTSGISGIYIMPSGSTSTSSSSASATSTSNFGTTSSTGSFYSTQTSSFSTVPLASCSTGAFYTSGKCRNQASITVFNTIKFSGQNIVYAGVSASNLPDKLSSANFSNLIVAKLVNNPQNNVNIYLSAYNKQQWVANISFTDASAPLNLVLSWNVAYSSLFTPAEINYVASTAIIPGQVAKFNITVTPTNSLVTNDDVLVQGSISEAQIAAQLFDSPK